VEDDGAAKGEKYIVVVVVVVDWMRVVTVVVKAVGNGVEVGLESVIVVVEETWVTTTIVEMEGAGGSSVMVVVPGPWR